MLALVGDKEPSPKKNRDARINCIKLGLRKSEINVTRMSEDSSLSLSLSLSPSIVLTRKITISITLEDIKEVSKKNLGD